MTQKRTQIPKPALPGYLYQCSGCWWWRVRLPGEDQPQTRPLRQQGEAHATRHRNVAEQIALGMWQAALVSETEKHISAKVRSQAREKSRAYAYLIDLLCEGILRNPRLEPTLEVYQEASDFDESEEESTNGVSTESEVESESVSESKSEFIDVLESPLGIGHVSDISDILSMLSERQSQHQDQTGCDCCGGRDFYEEYLHRIDSGQRLCPRCFKAFQEKIHQMTRSLCHSK